MIRSIPHLGCTPGGDCCASCATHRLGDVQDTGDVSSTLWITLGMMLGGFLLALGASGKVKLRR